MKYSDQELVAIIQQQLFQANGSSTGNGLLQQNRMAAIDYYLTRLPAATGIPGRSMVISPDVRDSIQAVLAQMAPLYASEFPAEFVPERQGDEQAAAMETMAVCKVIANNNGYAQIMAATHDALLCKNGYIKVWIEEYSDVQTARFRGGDAQDNAALLAMAGDGAEMDDDDGEAVSIRITKERPRVRLESIAPERMYIDANLRSIKLTDANFIAEYKPTSKSDLILAGYNKELVMGLQISNGVSQGLDQNVRQMGQANNQWATASTPEMGMVDIYEVYMRIAMKGDVATLWRFIMADQGEILDKEEVTYMPYAGGVVMTLPHRADGISMYDLCKQSQDVGTAALRQWIDSNSVAVQNRLVVGPQVNTDDLMNAGPNQHIRLTRGDDVGMAVMPLPFTDIGGSCEQLLNYKDRMRTQASGASLDLQGAEPQMMTAQVGAMGADRIMSSQEQVAGLYTRNLSESLIRDTFLLVHRCLRHDFDESMTLKLGDQWVEVNPTDWLERTDCAVRVGLTPGERNRKVGALTAQLQVATQAMQSGLNGVLIDTNGLYQILMDLARAQELEGADQYWIDPKSQRSQQAQQQMAAQNEKQKQLEIQVTTLSDQVNQQKNQITAANDAAELRYKYWDSALRAEIEEAKIVGSATLELQRLEREGQARSQEMLGQPGEAQAA